MRRLKKRAYHDRVLFQELIDETKKKPQKTPQIKTIE